MTVQKPGDNTNNGKQGGTTMSEAFSDAGKQSVGSGEQAQRGSASRPSGSQAGGRANGRRPGLAEINTAWGRPVSRRTSGEAVKALDVAIRNEMAASIDEQYKDSFKLLILNNQTNQTLLSSLLLVLNVQDAKGTNHSLVFNLAVEGSGPRRDSRFVPINGTQVEIEWVPGDTAAEAHTWTKIENFLSEQYGRQTVLHYVGAMVLPIELSPEDEAHIHSIVFTATQALYTAMENDVTQTESPISVSMLDNGATMSATLDYNPAPMANAVGLPVRNDLQITLKGLIQGQQSQTGYDQPIDLTRVSGYIDLLFAEQQPPAFGQQPPTQRYYPRYVMTLLDSEVDAITPELQLLSLSTATLLARNMQWGAAFAPRFNIAGGQDLRDIGALGYEVNLSPDPNAPREKFDTKSQSFGLPQLATLLGTTIFDQLVYSLDIDEAGELTWLHQVFLAAAGGNADAYQSIIDSANNLTDGHFARLWQGGPIVVDDSNRIHTGYFTGNDGLKHDVREIDYLAMLNLMGHQDLSVVVQWSDSFLNSAIPEPVRVETRARILKSLLNDFKHKGFARRVNFTPEFLTALAQACANAGLGIRQQNTFQVFTGAAGRGAFAGAQFGVNGQQVGSMFNFGQQPGYGGGFRGFGPSTYGRFGMGGSNV